MTTELWMLAATGVLHFMLAMVAALPRLTLNGIPWGLGNRQQESGKVSEWARRAQATSDNMLENIPLIVIAVVVVHLSGSANATSALGAQIFVGARVAHAAIYIGGVPYIRTASWMVSIAGVVMMASVLF